MTVRFSPCGEWVGGIRTDVVLFKYSKYYCWKATTAMSAGGSVGTWLEARSINNRFEENGHGKRRNRCGHSATTCPRTTAITPALSCDVAHRSGAHTQFPATWPANCLLLTVQDVWRPFNACIPCASCHLCCAMVFLVGRN